MQDPPHLLHPELANPVITRTRSNRTEVVKDSENEKRGDGAQDGSDGEELEQIETRNDDAADLERQPSTQMEEPPDGGFMAWAMCE